MDTYHQKVSKMEMVVRDIVWKFYYYVIVQVSISNITSEILGDAFLTGN